MTNMGTVPNNGAPNFGSGLWPMPDPATSSEADGAVNLSGIIKSGSDGSMSDSPPALGGNDGDIEDSKVVG